MNNSLAELNNRNLSIDNYTIGQPAITAVIEEQLKNLKFQGAMCAVQLGIEAVQSEYHNLSVNSNTCPTQSPADIGRMQLLASQTTEFRNAIIVQ